MRWFADCFVRFRPLVGVFLVAMTGLAVWGYLPDRPTELPSEVNVIAGADDADDDQALQEQAAGRWRVERAVENSFDIASSDAFLVVECDDLFRAESVRALRAMVRDVDAIPLVATVFWLDEIPNINVFNIADPILPADDAAPEAFPQVRDKVLNHPLLRGQLLSSDGRTMIMPVVYNWLYLTDESELTDGVVAVARAAIDRELAKLPTGVDPPQIRVRISGRVPLFLAREQAFDRNQLMFRLIGYGLALLLSILMLRGIVAVVIVSAAPMLGVFWTTGILRLLDVHVNELAVAVMPVLVSMIGLTDGVHLLVNIRQQRSDGASPVEAARWTIEHVGVACFLTSLTTAIGFGSLMLAHSSYVQDFGRACMYGVIIAFFAVTTFVPFVASTRLGQNIHRGKEVDLVGPYIERNEWVLQWLLTHRRLASGVSVAITLLLGVFCFWLRPDNRLANQLPSSSEAYQALEHCDRALGGIQFHQVRIEWPEETPADSTDILAAIRDVESLIDQQPLVSYPLSIRNILASFPGDPEDLQTQMTFVSLLPRGLQEFFYSTTDRRALVVARVQDQGIAQYEPVFDELDLELAKLMEKYAGFKFWQDGGPIWMSRNLFQIANDLATSLGTATVIILVVLAVMYRSPRIGMISVIPNMFPLVATGALLVLMGEPLYIASVCAFTVCLGIAVDDTIHFLSRYQQERAASHDVDQAIRRTYLSVGTPMVMTTLILISGFATVMLSDLPAHRTFAAMACATIGAAILGDLFALPALLATFEKRERN